MTPNRRLRRWLPDSFGGQLLALLLAGMALIHVGGLWVLSGSAGQIHPRASFAVADLFMRMYRTVDTLDAGAADRLLASMSDPKTRFSFALTPRTLAGDGTSGTRLAVPDLPGTTPPADPDGREADDAATARRTATLMTDGLGLTAQALSVCVGPRCVGGETPPTEAREALAPIAIEARLADGRWLRAVTWSELRRQWWWPISFWLQAGLIPIFLIVVLMVGRMIGPWRQLVTAANRASRGERIAALPVSGPREMRDVLVAFNDMQARLARFIDDRTRMLAALSHDFRRPLTSMRLWADLVDDDSLREPMVRTLAEMRTMVDETLALMRDEVALENTSEVSLRELLDQLVDEHAARQLDVAWSERPDEAHLYRCRPVALKRAFANVIDNAVRHGGSARLTLRRADRADPPGSLMITVDDQGPGLSIERLATIFEAPTGAAHPRRVAAPSPEPKRIGLGLAIARTFVRAHGGDLTLQAGPTQRGLRAIFWLPG